MIYTRTRYEYVLHRNLCQLWATLRLSWLRNLAVGTTQQAIWNREEVVHLTQKKKTLETTAVGTAQQKPEQSQIVLRLLPRRPLSARCVCVFFFFHIKPFLLFGIQHTQPVSALILHPREIQALSVVYMTMIAIVCIRPCNSTPPWGAFPRPIAWQSRGCQCQHRTIRFRKALGEMAPKLTFFAPTLLQLQLWRWWARKIGPEGDVIHSVFLAPTGQIHSNCCGDKSVLVVSMKNRPRGGGDILVHPVVYGNISRYLYVYTWAISCMKRRKKNDVGEKVFTSES